MKLFNASSLFVHSHKWYFPWRSLIIFVMSIKITNTAFFSWHLLELHRMALVNYAYINVITDSIYIYSSVISWDGHLFTYNRRLWIIIFFCWHCKFSFENYWNPASSVEHSNFFFTNYCNIKMINCVNYMGEGSFNWMQKYIFGCDLNSQGEYISNQWGLELLHEETISHSLYAHCNSNYYKISAVQCVNLMISVFYWVRSRIVGLRLWKVLSWQSMLFINNNLVETYFIRWWENRAMSYIILNNTIMTRFILMVNMP